MAVTYKMLPCKGHNSPILKCIGMKKWDEKGSEFYKSNSKFAYFPAELQKRGQEPVGLIPYCKECVQKIFEHYFNESNNFQLAVYYTCQKIDIPFILELFDGIFKEYKETKSAKEYADLTKKYMSVYITNYNKASVRYKDKTDFSFSDSDMSTIDVKIESREKAKEELDKFKLDWGLQEEAEDYIFLNNTFKKYTKGVEFVNSQQEDLYRDLCRDRLYLRKINDRKYNGDETIDKIQSRIAKTMTTLKVDQFDSNKPKTPSEESFFAKIAQIEMTKPADLYKEPKKYKDFNKLEKYERDMVLRPLLNTLCNQRDFSIDIDDVEKYNMDEE